MHKTALTAKQIVEGLSPDISEQASSIAVVAKEYSKGLLKKPMTFKVGDYEVIVKASGKKSNPNLFISCTCKAWIFQGPEYHAYQNKYLLGKPKGSITPPTQRDPNGQNRVCKHSYAVLKQFFGA
jgi:hypothetical protein